MTDLSKERRRRVYVATVIMVVAYLIGTIGFYVLGQGDWSLVDCAYMTALTLSTVGYSEALPISSVTGAKVFTILLMLGGVAAVLYFASTFMAFLVEGDLQSLLGSKRMKKMTRQMKDHYVVCGVGRTGRHTVRQLVRAGHPVALVDADEEHIQEFLTREELELPYVIGDATEEKILKYAGIVRAKGLICALDSDHANLYTVLTAKELNLSLRVVAKVSDAAAGQKFKLVGADEVVSPTELGGKRLFAEMTEPTAVAFLEQLMLPEQLDLIVREIRVSPKSSLSGQTLAEADLRRQVGNVLILAIKQPDNGEYTYNPRPHSRLNAGASLIAMGAPDRIERFRDMAE